MKSRIALQSLALASLSSIALPSIAAQAEPISTETQNTFFAQIAAHCGQAFAEKWFRVTLRTRPLAVSP